MMSGAEGNVVPLGLGRVALGVRPSSDRPIARIHLLGSMRATTYLGDDMLPRGKKARALLGCLCLMARDSIPRGRLAAMLWDRFAEPQARANFRQALRELSTAIGPLATELIHADRETVRFKAGACWIDAIALMANERWASNTQRSDLAVLCSGELLEELDGTSASFDQWLLGERSRFSERLRTLLESEIEQAEQPGQDVKHLAAVARRLIAFDPTHEGASRTLMRALGELGERGQAIREFDRCREALRTLLDAEPSTKTRAVYDAVRNFTGKGTRAEQVNEPIRLQRSTETRAALPGRNRLRIAVLPFLGDRSSKEENLAFSLSQEIAAELARFRWFDVITPVSLMCKPGTDAFSGFQLTLNEMDYLVEGSLSGNRHSFKVSVRLRDVARYAQPVWSDSFKLQVGELHQLDEMVTARIVSQIDPVILFIEGRPKRREHYGATGLLFLAIPLIYSMERKKYEEAGRLIEQALEIEPDNGKVLAWAAYWNLWHAGQNWGDLAGALANAERLCLRAIRADPDNAEAMGIYAHTCAWKKDFDNAVHFYEMSLRLNPNLTHIWALSAATYCYIGEPDIALARLHRYKNLAPFDPYFCFFEHLFTIAYTFKGEYEQAALVGRRSVKINPDFVNGYKPLVAALGHLGRREEAKGYIAKLLSLEPGFNLEDFRKVYPFKHEHDRDRYMEGLRLAGVPERN